MHELSLSSAIVDTVERHAAGRRVTAVNMRIGTLRQVVPDSLTFYFEIVSRETVCDGARLEHELVGACCGVRDARTSGTRRLRPWRRTVARSTRCRACRRSGVRGAEAAEARCWAADEFEVESIEVEASEAKEEPCTAPR